MESCVPSTSPCTVIFTLATTSRKIQGASFFLSHDSSFCLSHYPLGNSLSVQKVSLHLGQKPKFKYCHYLNRIWQCLYLLACFSFYAFMCNNARQLAHGWSLWSAVSVVVFEPQAQCAIVIVIMRQLIVQLMTITFPYWIRSHRSLSLDILRLI